MKKTESHPPKIVVLGLRSFPGVQGGIETHAEHLYPRLVRHGCQVTVIARAPFHAGSSEWNGVRFFRLWSPRRSGAEAFLHTFLGVLYAASVCPDLLHIHGVGPAFFVPLARMLGLRVLVTHHGRDYERDKWGRAARWVLRTGEAFAATFADAVICVAKNDAQRLLKKHPGRKITDIPNGVVFPSAAPSGRVLLELGLEAGKYVLNVARVVPEKRQIDLLEAFAKARLPGWKLVLVGGVQHPSYYSHALENAAARSDNCLLAGFRTGDDLHSLFANAGLFVLPSSHEGLPISLLEALSFGLPCIASDILANREVGLPDDCHFPVGNTDALAERLEERVADLPTEAARREQRGEILARFDWDRVSRVTHDFLRLAIA